VRSIPGSALHLIVPMGAEGRRLNPVTRKMVGFLKTEPYTCHEHNHMNDYENKPADKDAPRGLSDELVDGDTLDVTDDPSKEEEELLERHDKPS
jgi:hypothetical protein